MARIFVEGFESGAADLMTTSGTLVMSQSGYDMSGNYMLELWGASDTATLTFPTSHAEIYLAFKYRLYSIDNKAIITIRDSAGANVLSVIRNTASKFIEIRLGRSDSTLLDTGTIAIEVNTTYLFELHYKPLNSGGVATVRINGTEDATYTGDTTAAAENVQTIMWGYDNSVGYTAGFMIDDVIIDDADWVGNTKIIGLTPNAAGATNSWDCWKYAWEGTAVTAGIGSAGTYQNSRTVIPASGITTSGAAKAKIRIETNNSGTGVIILGCSIGERSGSTSSFTGTPTRVTFGGSNSITLAAPGSTVSDAIPIAIDETKDYLVHFYMSTSRYYYISDASSTWYYENSADADDTLSTTVSGYTTSASNRLLMQALLVEITDGTANYLTVDEIPVSNHDYVFTTTENAVDTYALSDLAISVGTIKSVTVQTRNWRTGNGTVSKLQHVIRPASTDRVGATVNGGMYIPVSPTGFQTIWSLNPEDSAAWEAADINGMEAGIKAVTS